MRALSQEIRLKFIRYLVRCGAADDDDIGKQVKANSSRLSFHLFTLFTYPH
ncbi:MAG: hypothetical protein AAGF93_17990 [Cyanobacteria bacterium P01_H01_bin.105]